MSIHICDHCGKPIADDATVCPYCGEELAEDIRLTKIPETIEELKAFCAEHKMPLDAMRFFIGENFKGARAFGIYKDESGNCVVYKNKADGSRAIRYEGPDEKRAVRELYEKLKSETDLRRGVLYNKQRTPPAKGKAPERAAASSSQPLKLWEKLVALLIAAGLAAAAVALVTGAVKFIRSVFDNPERGYYRYQDDTYYFQDFDWYLFNAASNVWVQTYDVPEELERDYGSYYASEDYDFSYPVTNFSDSGYYYDDEYDDDDWDDYSSDSSYDDYDWDSSDYSSWDSSDTDWDSDW